MHTKIVDGVDWVGVIDWSVRDFHGYRTQAGSTYNAYLVRGDKTTLIDTVKAPFANQLLANIAEVTPLGKVDYIVCQHAEPDHSSALPTVLEACPQAELLCTAKCKDTLSRYYDTTAWRFRIIADSEELNLGSKTLQFIETPMVHWPESTATYLKEDQLLFSMDIFGQHYATSARFDDEVPYDELFYQTKTYYANIVMPFGKMVARTLDRVGGLTISVLCPSHGVCWRSHISELMSAYAGYAVCAAPQKKVVILYASMWGSTRQMAEAIAEGVASTGVNYKLIDVSVTHETETITEIIDCTAVAVGSPTLNLGMLPAMARTLTYIKGMRPSGKSGLAFGSFGWGEKGATEAEEILKSINFNIIQPAITVKYKPDADRLEACRFAGKTLAEV